MRKLTQRFIALAKAEQYGELSKMCEPSAAKEIVRWVKQSRSIFVKLSKKITMYEPGRFYFYATKTLGAHVTFNTSLLKVKEFSVWENTDDAGDGI